MILKGWICTRCQVSNITRTQVQSSWHETIKIMKKNTHTLFFNFFPLPVTHLKSRVKLNFQHLFHHGSTILGNEAAKITWKKSFLKILRSTVSWTRMTNWYKKRERKEVLLSCHEREKKRKNFESSPEVEHNTFGLCARTLTISIKSNCNENTLF